ncbi:MAG: FtsW/RodA/SpoVE family cell cycle protein [Eggerthellaceae bacterium]|nr:FtsW/RodA/SpoVE family cell cycle protein [Eggerthellaceae bacterium]
MTRRNTELLLLLLAVPLVIVLFAMLVINDGDELNLETLSVPIGIFIGFFLAHFAIRRFAPDADPAILPITFALSSIGIAFVTRISPDLAVRQVVWLYAGIVCMVLILVFLRNVESVANYKYILVVLGILLLLSPLIPVIGQEQNGGQLWLKIGPISFQPGELAKICIVLFLAAYLAGNRELLSVFTWKVGPFRLPDLRTLLPMIIMWALAFMVVVVETDLGLALVLFSVFLVMLYVATGKRSYIFIGIVLAAIASVALYFLFSHVQTRVEIWLDPFGDPYDKGYQIVQSLYAMADGDILGVGIGRGLGADLISYAYNDAIFAVIAEEGGLLGAAGILLLYLCFAIRGLVTAARARSDVSSLIAVGLTSIIILQAFIIVGGITGLIPLTGITLPFIAQGGSSLISSFIIVGFILRCGNESGPNALAIHQSTTTALVNNSVLGRVALGKRITGTMVLYSILLGLLIANLTYIMIFEADELKAKPSNTHTIIRQSESERGTISTYDGVILAQSVEEDDGTYERVYPQGDLAAHIIGYTSETYGTSGIEAAYNETLQGNQDFATWTDALNYLAGISNPGNDITLTINSQVQIAAQNALAGRTGACVVIDPQTGAILAMASSPTYDVSDVDSILAAFSTDESDSSALFNRATQALYAPGSTFKIITLAAALEDGVATADSVYSAPGSMEIGNAEVTNSNDAGYGDITLARATELSANTVFAQVGVELGADRLVAVADDFGFDKMIEFALPLAESLMPSPDEMTTWETAWAACGEPVGEHDSPAGPQATVLEMALVGCAIANDGIIMQPYIVDSIYNPNGEKSFDSSTSVLTQAISSETAAEVRSILEGVVSEGTGGGAAVSGVTVAGKTGTAENGDGTTNSWFVGMAPSDDSDVVIAMVIEEGESGIAASLSSDVLRAALEVEGDL